MICIRILSSIQAPGNYTYMVLFHLDLSFFLLCSHAFDRIRDECGEILSLLPAVSLQLIVGA